MKTNAIKLNAEKPEKGQCKRTIPFPVSNIHSIEKV